MISARFVPIQQWPGEATKNRKVSPFVVKYQKNLDDLERELKHLGAREIVVQAFLREEDIRNDGWPRSSAIFRAPGIVLSFRTRDGSEISFPCDTYRHWECNLRAICLTLTALRAIDRYGVTKRAEQYTGWKRLAAPVNEQRKDVAWAWSYLAALCEADIAAVRASLPEAYRKAAKKTHPDSGGNTEAFQLLQDAMKLIGGAA